MTGKGIKQDDVEIAFLRHTTSKIRSAKDLEEVKTLGFRGEALASIAAISKIQLLTKTENENMGTKIELEAGDVLNFQPTGASTGTSITITDLFFNTPVRYKFLKKDYTEAGYIEDIVRKLAIINKEIAFKLINNGKVILQTTGNDDIKSVIYSIFGEEIANSIIETDYSTENIKVTGVVGKPEIARSNRRNQMFYVNGRYVKDNTLTAATTKAFKGLIPLGRFGFCILNIQIDPKLIDVNVHPTKEEIRFKDEQEAFKAVNTAIHNALAKSELVENIFVPKYDENNFTHFNSYTAGTDNIPQVDEKEVQEILKQPEENMIKHKKKSGFFNFKEKKSERDIEEEELEKKHSEIYETLMKNPKFSYEEMLKEKEQEEKGKQENEEEDVENQPKFDWIGEEQTTEKISKIKEQIDRTSSLNIHTILNRYKEQVEEEETEKEERLREGLKEDKKVIEDFDKKVEEIKEELEQVEENDVKSDLLQEIEEKLEKLKEDETKKEDEGEVQEQQKIVEEKYKALFESYKPGDYLKEEVEEEKKEEPEVVQEDKKEEDTELEVVEEEVKEEQKEETEEIKEEVTEIEEKIEDVVKSEEEPEEEIKEEIEENQIIEKKLEVDKNSEDSKIEEKTEEPKSILEQIQSVLEQDAVTKTPELKPLAEDTDEEHKDEFTEGLKEAVISQATEELSDTSGFKSAEEESFVKEKELEEKDKNILSNIAKSFEKKTENPTVEAQNIVSNLIAQKIEKGEITNVLDLDAINKILEEELKEKHELNAELEKQGSSSRFDFAKMYKRAFGVDSFEIQQEKKAFEESINMSQSFKAPEITLFDDSDIPPYSVIGVVFGTYIIVEMKDSIYIIDQHATHERLLYEEVKFNYYNDQYKDSQTLLLPDVITLSYREMEIVRKNVGIFKKAGFELEEFGINTIKLVAVPSMTEILNTKELFLDILDEIDDAYITGKDEIEERFLSTIACKAAVKANMALDEKEIRALLDDLLRLHNPFTCPHGRPTAIKMTKADLERKFARR